MRQIVTMTKIKSLFCKKKKDNYIIKSFKKFEYIIIRIQKHIMDKK